MGDAELDKVFLANSTLNSLGIGFHNETWRLASGSGANPLQLRRRLIVSSALMLKLVPTYPGG